MLVVCHQPTRRGLGASQDRGDQLIARLVAGDLSNKQIAARLLLSERTVETHITNILNKLGLNSRVQVSRWMTEVTGPRPIGAGERP